MGTARVSRRAHEPDSLARDDLLTEGDIDAIQVGVPGLDAHCVLDDHEVAPAAERQPSVGDAPRGPRGDRNSGNSLDIDTGVETVSARAERTADRTGHGPREADRALGQRLA